MENELRLSSFGATYIVEKLIYNNAAKRQNHLILSLGDSFSRCALNGPGSKLLDSVA